MPIALALLMLTPTCLQILQATENHFAGEIFIKITYKLAIQN